MFYTNDLDAVATSALKMVSLELDTDIDITICGDDVGCYLPLLFANMLIWPNSLFCFPLSEGSICRICVNCRLSVRVTEACNVSSCTCGSHCVSEICSVVVVESTIRTPSYRMVLCEWMHEVQEINSQVTQLFQPSGSSNRWPLLCRVLRTYGH